MLRQATCAWCGRSYESAGEPGALGDPCDECNEHTSSELAEKYPEAHARWTADRAAHQRGGLTAAERMTRLLQAQRLVEEVAKDLDSSVTVCECCEAQRYNHYGEFRAHIELVALAGKLDKWRLALARGLNREKVE